MDGRSVHTAAGRLLCRHREWPSCPLPRRQHRCVRIFFACRRTVMDLLHDSYVILLPLQSPPADACIVILYSFSLLTTTVTHMNVIADIWTASVREVPWFVGPSTSLEYTPRVARTEKTREPDVLDIKRMSFHYPTPIFAQFAKALPPPPNPESRRASTAPPSPI